MPPLSAHPALPVHRSATLQRPDCRIHYEVTGEGPPIVFAHGLGGNHLSWWQQVPHFAPRHTCVAFSHRGFAPSTPPSGGPDPLDFAGDIEALLDLLALERPVIVAQSMGGWGAVEFALRHPGRLRGLVLAATTGSLDPGRIEDGALQRRLEAWSADAQARTADALAAGIHPAIGVRMAAEQPAHAHLYRAIDAMSAGLDKGALRGRLFAMRARRPEALAGAGCPVLFVAGDEDIVLPPFAADAIAPMLPQARVVRFPDAGHSAYFERPDAFNLAVAAFMDALPR